MAEPFVAILGLHHYAYRCRDCEETRAFYEDLLGLPLVHVIRADTVPSTGEHCPYVHIFFRMADGSHLAFFDLGDDVVAAPSPNTPAWVNHIALRVESVEALRAAKERLEAAGVEVLGITDHHIIESIYFFDPNGIRLELTVPVASADETAANEGRAHAEVAAWTREKRGRLGGREDPHPRPLPQAGEGARDFLPLPQAGEGARDFLPLPQAGEGARDFLPLPLAGEGRGEGDPPFAVSDWAARDA